MTPTVQTALALGIVSVTVLILVFRALAKRRNPGCGGECGCPASEIRAKARH